MLLLQECRDHALSAVHAHMRRETGQDEAVDCRGNGGGGTSMDPSIAADVLAVRDDPASSSSEDEGRENRNTGAPPGTSGTP